MSLHAKFWLGWTVVGFIYEMVYIFLGKPEGTLSWQLWALRNGNERVFAGLFFLLAWSLYHFQFEGRRPGEGYKSFAFTAICWFVYCIFFTGSDPIPPGGGTPPVEL